MALSPRKLDALKAALGFLYDQYLEVSGMAGTIRGRAVDGKGVEIQLIPLRESGALRIVFPTGESLLLSEEEIETAEGEPGSFVRILQGKMRALGEAYVRYKNNSRVQSALGQSSPAFLGSVRVDPSGKGDKATTLAKLRSQLMQELKDDTRFAASSGSRVVFDEAIPAYQFIQTAGRGGKEALRRAGNAAMARALEAENQRAREAEAFWVRAAPAPPAKPASKKTPAAPAEKPLIETQGGRAFFVDEDDT